MAAKDRNRKSQSRYLYPAKLVSTSKGDSYENDRVFMDWLRIRQVLEHEDYLLIERAKLLIAVQTILSALIYFVLNSSFHSKFLVCVLCIFGVLMSLHLTMGMYKAKRHQNKIINWWFSRVGWTGRSESPRFLYPLVWFAMLFKLEANLEIKDKKDLPEMLRSQPPIAGRDPGIDKFNWSLPYWIIGGLFSIIWIVALIAFVMGVDVVPTET